MGQHTPPPPVRADLVVGPHPEDPEQSLVFDPRSGRRFALPTEAVQVASQFDGLRAAPELVADLRAAGGPAATPEVVEALRKDLAELGLLRPGNRDRRPPLPEPGPGQWVAEMLPHDLPMVAHPEARFSCIGAGTCCRSGYLIPVDGPGAERLRKAAQDQGHSEDPVVLLPTRPGRRWSHALHNEPSCPFLSRHRCSLHGSEAHPSACQMFPLAFTRVGARVHVTVTHRCVCGVFGDGPLLRRRKTELVERSRLGPVPRIFPFAAWDQVHVVDLDGAEAFIEVARQPRTVPQRLMRAWQVAPRGRTRTETGPPVSDVLRTLAAAHDLEDDPVLHAALLEGEHPMWPQIQADLIRVQAFRPQASAEAEIDRFLRDHLFGLRLYHHESVSRGLFALSLATTDLWLRRADGHARTRARIMMWEDAFASPGFRSLLGGRGPLGPELQRGDVARRWVQGWWTP